MTTAPAARSRRASGTNRTPKRPLRSPLAVDGDLAPSHAAGIPGEDAIPHRGAVLSDRAATLADFEDYLRTANSREGRPFGEATINAYVSPSPARKHFGLHPVLSKQRVVGSNPAWRTSTPLAAWYLCSAPPRRREFQGWPGSSRAARSRGTPTTPWCNCPTEGRARQVLAALEERMRQVGLELHPGKTRIVYCKDDNRRRPWGGAVSFDFLGYTFRARSSQGKRGRFAGFGPAVSGKAVKRMSETVASWHLRRRVNLTWEELAQWIGPVIRGWMSYYGRFNRTQLYPLFARINYHVGAWLRAKYRRLRPVKALQRAWRRVTTQHPNALPHWQWVTGF